MWRAHSVLLLVPILVLFAVPKNALARAASEFGEELPQLSEDVVQTETGWQTASPPEEETQVEPENVEAIEDQEMAEASDAGNTTELSKFFERFSMFYYGIFNGPPLQGKLSLQGTPDGVQDEDLPVQLKNWLGITYHLDNGYSITPTLYWLYTPVRGQRFEMLDPFVRFSNSKIIDNEWFNWYGDVRLHFPISNASRFSDLLAAIQTFHALTFLIGDSFMASLYTSFRYNYFGGQGIGNDVEIYFAPYLSYDVSERVSVTALYEMGASHFFGDSLGLKGDGSNLQPGVTWKVSNSVMLNPYLNLYPSDNLSFRTTSFGMSVTWNLF